jgi:hypothetical protein
MTEVASSSLLCSKNTILRFVASRIFLCCVVELCGEVRSLDRGWIVLIINKKNEKRESRGHYDLSHEPRARKVVVFYHHSFYQ